MTTPQDVDASARSEPSASSTPVAEPGVGSAARSNAAWTMGGFVAMQLIRFISNLILTRLAFPEVFGVMTLVNTVLQGIQMFTDVGIGPSLVQNKRGEDPDFLNTAWTITVVRGVFLWVCACFLSVPMSMMYADYLPPLYLVLPAVSLSAAINGFESTSIYTLQRRMLRARRVILEVATYLGTMVLTITGVWLIPDHFSQAEKQWWSVWALVISNLFSTVVQMVISHFLIPNYRNRFCWDRPAVKELFHFGKWVFISTMLTFLAMQSDKFIVGVDQEKLGIYSVAFNLAMIPAQMLNTLGWQLVFPLYSRLHREGRDIRKNFARIHPLVSAFAAYLVAGLVATGPTLVRFLYDPRYQEAGWMLQFLAVGVWFQSLEVLECSILWTQGETRAPTLSNLAKVVALFVLVPLGSYFFGFYDMAFHGMLLGFVIADGIRYAFTMRAVSNRGVTVLPYDTLLSLGVIVSAGVAMVVGEWLVPAPQDAKRTWVHLITRGGLEGGLVTVAWLLPALVGWKRGLFRGLRQTA